MSWTTRKGWKAMIEKIINKIIGFFRWVLAPEKLEQTPLKNSADDRDKTKSFVRGIFAVERLPRDEPDQKVRSLASQLLEIFYRSGPLGQERDSSPRPGKPSFIRWIFSGERLEGVDDEGEAIDAGPPKGI